MVRGWSRTARILSGVGATSDLVYLFNRVSAKRWRLDCMIPRSGSMQLQVHATFISHITQVMQVASTFLRSCQKPQPEFSSRDDNRGKSAERNGTEDGRGHSPTKGGRTTSFYAAALFRFIDGGGCKNRTSESTTGKYLLAETERRTTFTRKDVRRKI